MRATHLWGSLAMSPGGRAMSQVAPLRAARRALQRRRMPPALAEEEDGPGWSSMASPGCVDGAAVGRGPDRPGRLLTPLRGPVNRTPI